MNKLPILYNNLTGCKQICGCVVRFSIKGNIAYIYVNNKITNRLKQYPITTFYRFTSNKSLKVGDAVYSVFNPSTEGLRFSILRYFYKKEGNKYYYKEFTNSKKLIINKCFPVKKSIDDPFIWNKITKNNRAPVSVIKNIIQE